MTAPEREVDRLVTDFVERVPGVAHAVVVAADGVPAARSTEVPADRAEQVAAITSGLAVLTAGASRVFRGGPVRNTVIEMRHGTLLVTSIGHGAALAVLTSPHRDRGLVSREIALLGGRVGREMSPAPRPRDGRRHGTSMTGVLARALTVQLEKSVRPEDGTGSWFDASEPSDVYRRDDDPGPRT